MDGTKDVASGGRERGNEIYIFSFASILLPIHPFLKILLEAPLVTLESVLLRTSARTQKSIVLKQNISSLAENL